MEREGPCRAFPLHFSMFLPEVSLEGKEKKGRFHLILHPGAAAGSLLSQGAVLNSQPAKVAKDNGDAGKELFLLPDPGQHWRLQEAGLVS